MFPSSRMYGVQLSKFQVYIHFRTDPYYSCSSILSVTRFYLVTMSKRESFPLDPGEYVTPLPVRCIQVSFQGVSGNFFGSPQRFRAGSPHVFHSIHPLILFMKKDIQLQDQPFPGRFLRPDSASAAEMPRKGPHGIGFRPQPPDPASTTAKVPWIQSVIPLPRRRRSPPPARRGRLNEGRACPSRQESRRSLKQASQTEDPVHLPKGQCPGAGRHLAALRNGRCPSVGPVH